jgi:hypothetical protein
MNADRELHDAIQERIAKENAFFNLIKTSIKNAEDEFEECDTSTSPEVEDSVQLSIAGLNDVVRKLKDETVLNKEAARGITDYFIQLARENHVVQDNNHQSIPDYFSVPSRPLAPLAPATPIVTGKPAPSLVDRAKGFFGVRPNPQRAQWDAYAADPIANPIPVAGPIYQAERDNHPNPYGKGGRKRTRKYRRRV